MPSVNHTASHVRRILHPNPHPKRVLGLFLTIVSSFWCALSTSCTGAERAAVSHPDPECRALLYRAESELQAARARPLERRRYLERTLETTDRALAHARAVELRERLLHAKARALMGLGDAPQAALLLLAQPLAPAVRVATKHERALLTASALLDADRLEEALSYATRAITSSPPPAPRQAAALQLIAARAALRLGRFELAARHAARCVANAPTLSLRRRAAKLARWANRRTRLRLEQLRPTRIGRFLVRSNAEPSLTGPALKRLRLAAPAFDAVLPIAPNDPRAQAPYRVYLLAPATYGRLGGSARRAHAFFHREERAVFCLAEQPAELARLLIHEAAHAHLARLIESPPAWLDEGLADHLATARPEPGAPYRFRFPPHPVRLRDVRLQLELGRAFSLETLLTMAREPLYAERAVASSWAWVHFLYDAEDGRYRPLLTGYIDALRTGAGSREAWQSATKRWLRTPQGDALALSRLESAWRGWILALPAAR